MKLIINANGYVNRLRENSHSVSAIDGYNENNSKGNWFSVEIWTVSPKCTLFDEKC